MLFISKMIFDPTKRMSNKMGLTIGLTVHTPKFWDCSKYDFDFSQFDTMRDELSEETMERRAASSALHSRCRWPHRHIGSPGYAYWTGPKRRYTFRYMGPTISVREVWWKPFSVREHRGYVRWLDNGPQSEPIDRSWLEDPTWREIQRVENEKFNAVRERSHQQMAEYRNRHKDK